MIDHANELFNETIARYAPQVRQQLVEVRRLILERAGKTEGVGKLFEALRWGQFSFLTLKSGSGSTIRIDGHKEAGKFAIYFHCQSGLVNHFKQLYPKIFNYEGERALIFDAANDLPSAELSHCISLALTHHLRKKSPVTTERKNVTAARNHHRH